MTARGVLAGIKFLVAKGVVRQEYSFPTVGIIESFVARKRTARFANSLNLTTREIPTVLKVALVKKPLARQ